MPRPHVALVSALQTDYYGGDCRTAPATPGLLNITENVVKYTTEINIMTVNKEPLINVDFEILVKENPWVYCDIVITREHSKET